VYRNGGDNMGLSAPFGKKHKFRKLVKNYVTFRVKEKRAFDEQRKLLAAQLRDKIIDPHDYERLREVLEANYFQQQQEEWAKIKNKFYNPLNS
jgi:predicted Ser/Thr protein kinase